MPHYVYEYVDWNSSEIVSSRSMRFIVWFLGCRRNGFES